MNAINLNDFLINYKYKDLYNDLINLITEILQENPKIYKSDSITMHGFLWKDYKGNSYPYISIAPQKNAVSLYVFYYEDKKAYIEQFSDIFKKSNVGKSCIRLRNLETEKLETIKKIITHVNIKMNKKYE